jgi:glyceraldehyde-3-phosphate dehydrogenase (NADP+)
VVPSSTNDATPLVEDERIKLLSFTGSPAVGWDLKRRAGRKRITLELGGNAAVIVHHDADVAYAAERIVWGGFAYSGQTCISVQRVYAHETVYDALVKEVLERVRRLKTGDPLSEDTDLGPLIDGVAASRVQEWLEEAVAAGAVVLAGGARSGWVWEPTVVTSLPSTVRMSCQEVFAPVVSIDRNLGYRGGHPVGERQRAWVQAGIFTHDDRVIAAASDDTKSAARSQRRLDVPRRPHAVGA